MTNLKEKTEELERRGNKGLGTAQRDVSLFHTSIICLQEKALDLEALHEAMENYAEDYD